MKRICIITGTSRGIGKALVDEMLKKGIKVISINRNSVSQDHELHVSNLVSDLSNIDHIPELAQKIHQFTKQFKEYQFWLINNAARLGQVKKMIEEDIESIEKTITTNLTSPLLLSAQLLRLLKETSNSFRLINISSGAAFQAISGLSPYCISKAGLEMMTKAFDEELKHEIDFKSLAIGPGVVDTQMQNQLRSSTKENFERVDDFKKFKEKGYLSAPENIAEKIISYLMDDLFESGGRLEITNS